MPKRTIVIIYPYFFPGFRAGGPVQSLVNMVRELSSDFEFKVITSAFDLHKRQPYAQVQLDHWNLVDIGDETEIHVWYNSSTRISLTRMSQLIRSAKADIVFVNGLFTVWSFAAMWLFRWGKLGNLRLILSPRGMLQKGALLSSAFKKKIYFLVCRFFRLFNGLEWHATNLVEQQDIISHFGSVKITVADNIPKKPRGSINVPSKRAGELTLVYLSLISEKKNLLLLLESMSKLRENISLDIYGPVKDEVYWRKCLDTIRNLPSNIRAVYRGEVNPEDVQSTLEEYHAFISLTKGENFGHALYESLSVGRPIMTSYYTPWTGLRSKQAGWNIDISNTDSILKTLIEAVQAGQAEWELLCFGAWSVSKSYYEDSSFRKKYLELFS